MHIKYTARSIQFNYDLLHIRNSYFVEMVLLIARISFTTSNDRQTEYRKIRVPTQKLTLTDWNGRVKSTYSNPLHYSSGSIHGGHSHSRTQYIDVRPCLSVELTLKGLVRWIVQPLYSRVHCFHVQ